MNLFLYICTFLSGKGNREGGMMKYHCERKIRVKTQSMGNISLADI